METDVFNPSPSKKKEEKASAGVAAKAGIMAGAGVAGVGLGAAAGTILNGDAVVENPEDLTNVSDGLASGAGAATDSIPEQHVQSQPAPEVSQETIVTPEPEPLTSDDPDPIPTPTNPDENPVVVTPEEIDDNPDIAAILSGEEIDPRDVDMAQVVTFEELGTIYTVDGEELMAAAFHLEDGVEGVMVDVDSDGVFDNLAVLTNDGYIPVADAPGYTIDDVELQLNPEVNYLAQNDDQDHTLGDDDFADDIIDVTLA